MTAGRDAGVLPSRFSDRLGAILLGPLPHLRRRSERIALRLLLLLGARWIETENEEALRRHEGPLLIVLNHLNNLEALLTPAALLYIRGGRKVSFLSDWPLLCYPVLGWLVRRTESIPVWRKPAPLPGMNLLRRRAIRNDPMLEALRVLRGGGCVALYPEGTRNRDPHRLLRGRLGAARLALSTGCPVLPVGVDFRGRRETARVPRFPRLILRFGEILRFEPAGPALTDGDGSRRPTLARQDGEREATALLMEAIGRLSGKRPVAPSSRPAAREVYSQKPPPAAAARGAAPIPDRGPAADGRISVEKITEDSQLPDARRVVESVYVREKGWMDACALDAFPGGTSVSWFLVRAGGAPAGLLRLLYDPPLDFAPGYEVELRPGVDWKAIAARARIVEVGRFMIIESFRSRPKVVMRLMSAATREAVERGYTHMLTDVFEGDPHSPIRFHTRVLGFEQIGTHKFGEMKTVRRRIILALDIERAYLRMRARGGLLYQEFSRGYQRLLDERFPAGRKIPIGSGATAGPVIR